MDFITVLTRPPFQEPVSNVIHIDLITAVLVGGVLLACVISLALLFFYAGRVRSFGMHQHIIFDTLKAKRKGEIYDQRTALVHLKITQLKQSISQMEASLESLQDTAKHDLERKVQEEKANLEQASKELQEIEDQIEKDAEDFANSILPSTVSFSEQFGPYFFIEFGTVIIIIFTILGLALLGIIGGQESVTVLATIAGYVLGKTTSGSAVSNKLSKGA
jgi:small-conductance mechanosensitive channel